MKEQFINKRFNAENQMLLERISKVIDQYRAQGYKLTLRQLYYQLVAADIIPNRQNWYDKLSRILNDARYAGMVDWDIIEDRTRRPNRSSQWNGIKDIIESCIYSFRLPRHFDQDVHLELWTEKDALTSILLPITQKYHCHLVVNRGYSSASAMYRAYKRFQRAIYKNKRVVILYLGDHDPSGLDMDRDIKDRMNTFGVDVRVIRVGLTKDQIEEYDPPPNPAKVSDPRATGYIQEHGAVSWEVDAIRPQELDRIVRAAIEEHVDMEKYEEWIEREEPMKDEMRRYAEKVGNFNFDTMEDEEYDDDEDYDDE